MHAKSGGARSPLSRNYMDFSMFVRIERPLLERLEVVTRIAKIWVVTASSQNTWLLISVSDLVRSNAKIKKTLLSELAI